ncbi:MAG: hypothetical protein ACI8QC_004332 [Planctomycetota bacterium]|jgi:uncharacterized protein (TIGR00290 family)
MSTRKKTLLSWSSGKDSAWALHTLQNDPTIELVGLFTTLNQDAERVAMHGVRRELLRAQGRAAGLPVWEIDLPEHCSNEVYQEIMKEALVRVKAEQVEVMAFGDLFLEDVRDYRIDNMRGTGIEPQFPIWGIPTDELSKTMTSSGLSAILSCVDPKQLDPSFVGRTYDDELLTDLPEGVDPCGEKGEFHTFVTAGPMFSEPIDVTVGDKVERGGFHFADILPATGVRA